MLNHSDKGKDPSVPKKDEETSHGSFSAATEELRAQELAKEILSCTPSALRKKEGIMLGRYLDLPCFAQIYLYEELARHLLPQDSFFSYQTDLAPETTNPRNKVGYKFFSFGGKANPAAPLVTKIVKAVRSHARKKGEILELAPHRRDQFTEYLEENLPLMRREFKLHLNPSPEVLPLVVRALMSAVGKEPELRNNIDRLKVLCAPREDHRHHLFLDHPREEFWPTTPRIVIYAADKGSVGENIRGTAALIEQCAVLLAEYAAPACEMPFTRIPRFSMPISKIIHVAQSSGDLKELLARIPKAAARPRETLLDDFFLSRTLFAISRADEKEAQQAFYPLQNRAAAEFLRAAPGLI